jgi:hypothetical protein
MNRREFMATAASMATIPLLPQQLQAMPAAQTAAAPAAAGRWFAVSGNDEHAYAFWGEDVKDAARQYALENDATLGRDCPECGEIECSEHIDPHDWDEPQAHTEVKTHATWNGLDAEPTTIQWMRAGYLVECETCAPYQEPTDCYPHDGKALCEECLHVARIEKLERIIGIKKPSSKWIQPWQEA